MVYVLSSPWPSDCSPHTATVNGKIEHCCGHCCPSIATHHQPETTTLTVAAIATAVAPAYSRSHCNVSVACSQSSVCVCWLVWKCVFALVATSVLQAMLQPLALCAAFCQLAFTPTHYYQCSISVKSVLFSEHHHCPISTSPGAGTLHQPLSNEKKCGTIHCWLTSTASQHHHCWHHHST